MQARVFCPLALQLALVALLAPSAASYSNPFCGVSSARDTITVALACAPAAGNINAVTFAAYGTPATPSCGAFARGACDLAGFQATVAAQCVGRASCAVTVDHGTTDPCTDVVKTVAITATCERAPGGAQVPPAPSPSPPPPVAPSCATQDGAPPCPLPAAPWQRTWALSKSIICQPGNTQGFLVAADAARFGLVSLDWSIAGGVWRPGGASQPCNSTTGAAALVEQCRQMKAADPTVKCFVYRNTELALEWLEPQRGVMQDPTKRDFFLQYQAGNPGGVAPGTIYNEFAGGNAAGCKQFFWNYRFVAACALARPRPAFSHPISPHHKHATTQQPTGGRLGARGERAGAAGHGLAIRGWHVFGRFVRAFPPSSLPPPQPPHTSNANALPLRSQAIPQEHGDAPRNMGLSALQLATLQNDTHHFVQTIIATLAAKGKFSWQGFDGNRGGDPDEVAPAPHAANCAAYMEELCAPGWQAVPMTLNWDGANTTLAAFLIGRGPVAYLGSGWNGGPLLKWDARFDMAVGEPLGLCSSPSANVFSRAWTKGAATLDCNTFTATLAF
jgi:hypothetical protein